MKKFIYVVMATLLVGSQMTLSAQKKENNRKMERPTQEQMMQMQTGQMVKALMLDDATAAKFSSVYQDYWKALRECRKMNDKGGVKKETAANDAKPAPKATLTDAQLEKMMKDRFAQERKLLDIREKYFNEFRKFLSTRQILKVYQTEKSNRSKFGKETDRRKGQRFAQNRKPGGGKHAHGHHQPQK